MGRIRHWSRRLRDAIPGNMRSLVLCLLVLHSWLSLSSEPAGARQHSVLFSSTFIMTQNLKTQSSVRLRMHRSGRGGPGTVVLPGGRRWWNVYYHCTGHHLLTRHHLFLQGKYETIHSCSFLWNDAKSEREDDN